MLKNTAIYLQLVYLNGNNAAEGENNIKYGNSYPMNWTVKNWFARDNLNRYDRKWIEIVIGLGALWDWADIACKCPFIHQNLNLIHFCKQQFDPKIKERQIWLKSR